MATEAQLIARVEARLDTFEKQMKQAGVMADTAVKDIEQKFANANPTFASRVGGIVAGLGIGSLLLQAFDAAVAKVKDLINQFEELSKAAKFAGVTMEEAFALGQLGISTATLEKAAEALDRLRRGETGTTIAEIFRLNNVDVDNLRNAVGYLEKGFELIQGATSEVQARIVGEAFGFSRAETEAIRERTLTIEEFRAKLIETAGAALELRKGLNEASSNFQIINQVAQESGGWLQTIANVFNEITGNASTMTPQLRAAAEVLQRINQTFQVMRESGGTVGEQFRNRPLPPTVLPPLGKAATTGAAGGQDPLSSLERLTIEQEKQRDLAATELRLVGATNAERAVGKAEVQAMAAAQKDEARGLAISEELVAERTKRIKEAAAAEAEFQQKLRETNFIVNETKNILGESLKVFIGALREGKSAADALRLSLERISERLLDKAIDLALNMAFSGNITGTGTGGGLGQLIAGLVGGSRMAGGPVDAGKFYLVGENGPEMVRFGRSGVVMPNMAAISGGGSPGFSVVIENHSQAQVQVEQPTQRSDGVWQMKQFIRAEIDERVGSPSTGANRTIRMMGGKFPLTGR